MKKVKVTGISGYVLLLLTVLISQPSSGQTNGGTALPFQLKDGDRIVFLGNSLFENDFQYGYLETALTTRFSDKGVTFRNLGWTGDNVWGEARSTYTNPPTPYQHLMEDITKAQPTVVFLGYGGVEAQDGPEGLPHFKDGLNKLIDKIDSLGAKTILLSAIPVASADTAQRIAQRNADLVLYSKAVSEVASQRGKMFIDIYNPILTASQKDPIIENTVHLNELGYYYLAQMLEKSLGLDAAKTSTVITFSKNAPEVSNARMISSGNSAAMVRFAVDDKYLPLPLPSTVAGAPADARTVRVSGLKKGYYALWADNKEVATASAKDWENGVALRQGPQFARVEEIRNMILKKNEIHFFQYRPMNQTYITGFRKYEQGRHVKGLEDQNLLIKFLEGQIILNAEPKEVIYELRKVD